MYRLGIDIGSTTIKTVLIDADGKPVYSAYRRHLSDIDRAVQQVTGEIRQAVADKPFCVAVTGSVGLGLAERHGLRFVQEVVAAAEYTRRMHPEVRSLYHAKPLLDYGKADFLLDIPQDFERDLFSAMTSANISGNSVNMMKGGLGSGYLTNIVMEFASEIRMENISRSSIPARPVTFNIPTRYMYNQRADLKLFMLPVLLVILLTLLAGFVPAVHPVAYYLICEVVLWFAIALGALLLGIPALQPFSVSGLLSFSAEVFLLSTCYIFLWLGITWGVRRVARRPLRAMLAMLFVILSCIVLSGLFTPVSAMPAWAQHLTRLNPMQYMLEAMRIICLKG